MPDAKRSRSTYVCPPCERGDHHQCSEPGVCRCTINPDTGEDESTDDASSSTTPESQPRHPTE